MPPQKRLITCVDCHEVRPFSARDRCNPCYQRLMAPVKAAYRAKMRARNAGQHDSLDAHVLRCVQEGAFLATTIAREVGVSVPVAGQALIRLRNRGHVVSRREEPARDGARRQTWHMPEASP